MRRFIQLTLYILLYSQVDGQLEDVSLELGGELYANNSLIVSEDIGEHDKQPGALVCVATVDCASINVTMGSCGGEWKYPNGTSISVHSNGTQESVYVSTLNQSLLLNKPNGTTIPNGIYKCELAGRNGTKQQLYVGVYDISGGGVGIDGLTYDRESQTLVCTSSGGPVTNITWTKNGSVLGTTSRFFYSQAILDTVSGTYQHNLTFLHKTSSDSGGYQCIVGNSKSSSSWSVDVQVCEGNTVRLVENTDTISVSAETCVQDIWLNIVVGDNSRTQVGDTNGVTLSNLKPGSTALHVEWNITEQYDAGSIYEILCTTSLRESTQSVTHRVTVNQQTQATLNGLQPNSSYLCCVSVIKNSTESVYSYLASTCKTTQTLPEAVLSHLEIGLVSATVVLALLLLVTVCTIKSHRDVKKSHRDVKRSHRGHTSSPRKRKIDIKRVQQVELLSYNDQVTQGQRYETSPVFTNTNVVLDKDQADSANTTPLSTRRLTGMSANDNTPREVGPPVPAARNGKARLLSTPCRSGTPTPEPDLVAMVAKAKLVTPVLPARKVPTPERDPVAVVAKASLVTPILNARKTPTPEPASDPVAKVGKPRVATPILSQRSTPTPESGPADNTSSPYSERAEHIYSNLNETRSLSDEEAANPLYGTTTRATDFEAKNPIYGEVRFN